MALNRRSALGTALKSGLALIVGAIAGTAKSSTTNAQESSSEASVLHVAMNVTDMERTTRFYSEVFGFKAAPPIKPDNQAARIFGFPKLDIQARYLRLGNLNVLIRQFDDPKYAGPKRDLPVNYPGWGDIALRVSDIEPVISATRRLGGTVYENTRTVEGTPEQPGPEVIFIADPDGARVEVVKI